MKLANKKVLLTGATGGVGRCLALELANRRTHLILIGRNEEKLIELMTSLPNPERHTYIIGELNNAETVAKLSDEVKELGNVDVLINNAGGNEFKQYGSRSFQEIQDEVFLNLSAPMLLTHALLENVNTNSVIFNVGSTFGSIGYPGFTPYCAAKAGLHRFSEALDRELTPKNIRCFYLSPRAIATHLNDENVVAMNEELGNKSDSPKEVADIVVEMLEKNILRKWLGWPEKLFVKINQFFPELVSNTILKQRAVIDKYLK
ncbi:SDR family oxidoreductase [Vibrio sp.]|nr:SDR family oxidoreductase [Vibrio sp.]